jgi:AcrR family transcriptional regulator
MASKIRARILAAATECFAEHGFAGTSTKTIAERAKVNETSLFRLFGGKHKLFEEAFQAHAGPMSTVLLSPFLNEPDFRTAVYKFAAAYTGNLTEQLLRLEYVAFLEFPKLVQSEAQGWMPQFLAAVKKRIRAEQRAGRAHRRVNPESAALALNNILYHYNVQIHLFRYPKQMPFAPREKAVRCLVDAWFFGLQKSK